MDTLRIPGGAGRKRLERRQPAVQARPLCESGADKDMADQDGMTHLFSASGQGLPDVARLLRESGADADMADQDARRTCSAPRGRDYRTWRASCARAGRIRT